MITLMTRCHYKVKLMSTLCDYIDYNMSSNDKCHNDVNIDNKM